jgi:hypothetical protein
LPGFQAWFSYGGKSLAMGWQVEKSSVAATVAVACVALAVLSLLLPSAPTYDAYAWLIWGRDIAHLDLVTTGTGTSWKPLPALIAALFAPLGSGQPAAWLVVARAGALFACFMCGRLAWRVCGPRWGLFAAPVAAASLVLGHDFFKRGAVGQSEGLMTGISLLAIERHLDGRRGQAFALGVAAALLRPEVWPFLGFYGVALWFRAERPPRAVMAGLSLLIPLLWFGGDWIGSGSLASGSSRALRPVVGSPGASPHRVHALLAEAYTMVPVPVWIAAAVAVVWAAVAARQRRPGPHAVTLALAAGALAWIAVVTAMTAHGYAGVPRYLFMALALLATLAGIGVVRIAQAIAWAAARARLRPLAVPVAAAALIALCLLAAPDVRLLRSDGRVVARIAAADAGLAEAIGGMGGARGILRCGRPVTSWWAVTALAYDLGVQAGGVRAVVKSPRAVVFALAHDGGTRPRGSRRRLRTAEEIAGWRVTHLCPQPSVNRVTRGAPRPSGAAGSRRHAQPASRT